MLRHQIQETNKFTINNLRIALLNFLWAKKTNKRFAIRINDMVSNESKNDDYAQILELLALFGLEWDALYYQSQNRKFYHQFGAKLLSDSKAFSCFCSSQMLKNQEKIAQANNQIFSYDGTCEKLSDEEVLNNESPFCIRIKKPLTAIKQADLCGEEFIFKPHEVDSFIILNHDKSPTPNFANAIDDMLQGISLIIQEKNETLSSVRENYIRQSLGFNEQITYFNLEEIKYNSQAPTPKELLEDGFLPQAITNYLLSFNTNPPKEIFYLNDALEWFDISRLTCKSVQFDVKVLEQINYQHIIKLEPAKLAAYLDFSGEDFGKIAKLYASKYPTLNQLKAVLQAIFSQKSAQKGYEKEFEIIKNLMHNAPYFEEYEAFKNHIFHQSKLKGEAFTKPFLTLLLGNQDGVEPQELYPFVKNYLKEITR